MRALPRMLPRTIVVVLAAWVAASASVGAVDPDERLADPALEARARELNKELRCVVCQSQSIDDSDAPLAADLRKVVRERLVAGDSDEDVLAYVADRYGSYVLLKPPMSGSTALLWAAPALLLAIAALVGAFFVRRGKGPAGARAVAAPAPLSEEEEAQLAEMIDR